MMDKLQMRFFEFASEVFQVAAPMAQDPEMQDLVKELIMASSRMGSPFYRKHFCDFSEEEFEQNFSSARMDMHDTLLYLRMLIERCPGNRDLKVLQMKAKGFYVFLGGKVELLEAV
jgi:hypothetical protein